MPQRTCPLWQEEHKERGGKFVFPFDFFFHYWAISLCTVAADILKGNSIAMRSLENSKVAFITSEENVHPNLSISGTWKGHPRLYGFFIMDFQQKSQSRYCSSVARLWFDFTFFRCTDIVLYRKIAFWEQLDSFPHILYLKPWFVQIRRWER